MITEFQGFDKLFCFLFFLETADFIGIYFLVFQYYFIFLEIKCIDEVLFKAKIVRLRQYNDGKEHGSAKDRRFKSVCLIMIYQEASEPELVKKIEGLLLSL